MKYYRILFLAAALTGLASCAVDPLKEFEVEKPQNIAQYEYLNEYDVLKSYVDRTASPDFKLGAALAASDFTAQGQVYTLAVSNFDEMTVGNAMKYASVVGDKGDMSFDNVRSFVNAAADAGMTVYGHTLAWHSQQNNKYLNSLIADKERVIEERAVARPMKAPVMSKAPSKSDVIYATDFEDGKSAFGGWGNNSTREVVDGALKVNNPSAVNSWEAQMAYDVTEPFLKDELYKVKFKIKGTSEGSMSIGFQVTTNYSSAGEFGNAEFSTDWKDVELTCVCTSEESTRLIFSFGQYAGDIFIDEFEFSRVEMIPVKVIYATDFEDGKSAFGGWGNNSTRGVVDGALKVNNPSAVNSWEAQMAYDVTEPFEKDKMHYLSFKIKGSAEGSISVGFQVTSNYSSAGEFGSVDFTTEWKSVELSCACTSEEATRLIFSFGQYAGDIYIDDFEFSVEDPKDENQEIVIDLLNLDFEDGLAVFNGWGNNSTREVVDGALKITNPSAVNYWEAQVAYDFAEPFKLGQVYKMSFKVKGSTAGTITAGFQVASNYSAGGDFPEISITTEWQEVEVSATCTSEEANRLIFSIGTYAGDIYIDDFRLWTVEVLSSTIPLTPEEKKEVLTGAMDAWIKGMMQVTAEKVSAWDVVNEPISGVDGDGDGFYDLQSAANGDATQNFYWQDYLGNEDYVRIVVAKAREYYAEFGGTAPLKLFINDYNLESDWDNNKKLKSLIHWIEVWESDNVTKIDGIATQMHVSCYANPQTQASKKAAVVEMFKLMAATGKLVKISELDMGYVDANGNTVPTTSMTEAQHLAMAEYYEFIVSEYFKNVPAAQRYGITQWCITDAAGDLGTGWRGGEPVGLWDQNFNRKHTYAGFAEGLKAE